MKFVFRRTFAIVRITPAAAFDFTTAPLGLPARKSFGSIWKMMIRSVRSARFSHWSGDCVVPTRHLITTAVSSSRACERTSDNDELRCQEKREKFKLRNA